MLIWRKFLKSEKFCAVQPPQPPQLTTSAWLKTWRLPQRPDPKMLYQYQVAAHFSKRHRNMSDISISGRPGPNLSFSPESQKHPGPVRGAPQLRPRHRGRLSLSILPNWSRSRCTGGRARRQTSSWLLLTAQCFPVKQAILFQVPRGNPLDFQLEQKGR